MAAFHTFRAKLVVAMALVAVLPIGMLGLFGYSRIVARLETSSLDAAKERVAAAADEIAGAMGSAE